MTTTINSTPEAATAESAWPALSRRAAQAGLSLSMLLSSLGTSIANVGLPAMSLAFQASFEEVQWIVLAYLLAITSLIVSAGCLGDLVGRRRLLLAGVLLFTLASVICGMSASLGFLIAARAAQGLGAAVMMVLSMAAAGAAGPAARTGRAMGLMGAMSALGTALGPSLGGVLLSVFGWRGLFLVNVPAGILTFFLIRRHLPGDERDAGRGRPRFDVKGSVWLALTLAAYSFTVTAGRGGFNSQHAAMLLVFGGGLILFLRAEGSAANPLLPRLMFRTPGVNARLAMTVLVSTVMMATLVAGPFYLARALKLEAAQAGLVMSAGPVMAALAGLPAGRAVDRYGVRATVFTGLAGIIAGCLALALLPAESGVAGYAVPLIVLTAGYSVFQTANNTAVMNDATTDQRGGLSGVLNLSRNLGLLTGTSVMGAVFAAASGQQAAGARESDAVAFGFRCTFAVAALIAAGAMVTALASAAGKRPGRTSLRLSAGKALVISASILSAPQAGAAPSLTDPYPLNAAGWGPKTENGLFYSRWAEIWSGGKPGGITLPDNVFRTEAESSLTLTAEARFRFDSFDNGQLLSGNDYQQALFRGIAGADLRLSPRLRLYGELGTAQTEGRRSTAPASFQNDISLQQLFLEARTGQGPVVAGFMAGRQEFADGPRQLISLSDGPNLHRTWNGVRLYAHGSRMRIGAFDFRATRLDSGAFDEEADSSETIRGVNGSVLLSRGRPDSGIYLDPFWIHSANARYHSAAGTGRDERDTSGLRLWGSHGDFKFDWTLAHQTGESTGLDVDAWALFAVQSVSLGDSGWKPRLTSHIDIASGGDGQAPGFHQLYASSNYLGEGRFLSTSNLLLIAPGISVTPVPGLNLSAEYGFARRLTEQDAVYAGGMRAYPGTRNVTGKEIGGLFRAPAAWAVSKRLTVFLNYEYLSAGEVLQRAGLSSGSYGHIGATLRF